MNPKEATSLAKDAIRLVSTAGLGKDVIDFSTEVLPHYLGRIFTFQNNVYHRDIGTLESFEKAVKEFNYE